MIRGAEWLPQVEKPTNRFFVSCCTSSDAQLKLHIGWMGTQWMDSPWRGCLVSPGEARGWDRFGFSYFGVSGAGSAALLGAAARGCVPAGEVRILLGSTWARANSLGREKLLTEGVGGVGFVSSLPPKPSGGNLHPRSRSLPLCPASKCFFLLKCLLHLNLENIYSSCTFIFWEGHVDTESSSPVPTPLCPIKLRSIFPKMSSQGSVSLGCLVSFAPGVALTVFNGFAWLSGTHLKEKMCLLTSNLEDL